MSEIIELSLRGLPEWLIREYFKEMNACLVGNETEATKAIGDGWSVSWTQQQVQIRGSRELGLTQIDLVFVGSAIGLVHDEFMKKAQRGGG